MDAREAELRQAIADAPGDLDVRLVYADFLLERDDVRGEHIVLACAQDGETETAEMRRRALWQHHGAAWMADDLGELAERPAIEYCGGFVHAIRASAKQLVELGDRLARQPLRKLTVLVPPADHDAIAASPVLPCVRELHLGNRFDDADAATKILAAAAQVTHLALLLLHGSTNGDAIWRSLERYDRFDQLEHFELESIPLTAGRARWLADRLTRVKSMRLSSSTTAESLVVLAERMPELEHLHIDQQHRPSGDDSVFADALAGAWTRKLKSLALVGCPLGAKVAAQLARLPPTLTDLELSSLASPDAVAGLADCTFPTLTKLALGKCGLSDAHLELALRFPRLTELDLESAVIGGGIAALVALPLRKLSLLWSEINTTSIDTLVALRELRELSVGARSIANELPRLAAAPFDRMARLSVPGIDEAIARREFGEAWIISGRYSDTFERRLELSGAPVPYAKADRWKALVGQSGGRVFDPAAQYEIDDNVAHPDYGIGIVTHVEPIRIDVGFPQFGVVKLPLRPARAIAFDPDCPYTMGDVIDHPNHGICIVVLAQPNKLFVRLASGDAATIVPHPSLLDRVRGLLR